MPQSNFFVNKYACCNYSNKKLSSIIWVPSENGLRSALEARSWKHSGSEISWLTPHCCMSQKMWEVGQKDNLCTFHDMHQKIHSECKQPWTQHYNLYEKKIYENVCGRPEVIKLWSTNVATGNIFFLLVS